MVPSVLAPAAVRGPIQAGAAPSTRLSSPRNHEFLLKLRGATSSSDPHAGGALELAKIEAEKREPGMQMFRATSLEGHPSGAVAPDEDSVLGDGRIEPSQWLALFQPGVEALPAAGAIAPGPQPTGVADVSALVERWVRRVALGGDSRRGVARLDIGAGRFAGSELLVIAEAGQVMVELSGPGPSEPELAERLRSRLERRGYSAEVVVR